jgi:hypothetical protein
MSQGARSRVFGLAIRHGLPAPSVIELSAPRLGRSRLGRAGGSGVGELAGLGIAGSWLAMKRRAPRGSARRRARRDLRRTRMRPMVPTRVARGSLPRKNERARTPCAGPRSSSRPGPNREHAPPSGGSRSSGSRPGPRACRSAAARRPRVARARPDSGRHPASPANGENGCQARANGDVEQLPSLRSADALRGAGGNLAAREVRLEPAFRTVAPVVARRPRASRATSRGRRVAVE